MAAEAEMVVAKASALAEAPRLAAEATKVAEAPELTAKGAEAPRMAAEAAEVAKDTQDGSRGNDQRGGQDAVLSGALGTGVGLGQPQDIPNYY